MQSLGWVFQILGLVIVGAGFLIGFRYNVLRAELVMLAVGGLLFWFGQRLYKG